MPIFINFILLPHNLFNAFNIDGIENTHRIKVGFMSLNSPINYIEEKRIGKKDIEGIVHQGLKLKVVVENWHEVEAPWGYLKVAV